MTGTQPRRPCLVVHRGAAAQLKIPSHPRVDIFKAAIQGVSSASYKEILVSLNKVGNRIKLHNIDVIDFGKTVNELKGIFAKREGAKRIFKYIEEFGYTFANRKLQFESRVTNVDVTDRFAPVYYEFKSVNKVPPYDSNTQFIKDLSRGNVGDLSQIQWIFDGAKSPPDFKSSLFDAVDSLETPSTIVFKFTGTTNKKDLIDLISEQFEEVFILVD